MPEDDPDDDPDVDPDVELLEEPVPPSSLDPELVPDEEPPPELLLASSPNPAPLDLLPHEGRTGDAIAATTAIERGQKRRDRAGT